MWMWLRVVLVSLMLSGIGVSGPGPAEATPAEKDKITAVIDAQIEAFLSDDFSRAFTYASPSIRAFFGDAERFGIMVREGYPMVWRPSDVRYGPLREVAGNLWQRVEVRDQSGQQHLLDYQMVNTPEGWKINAVQLLPAPDANV